MLEWFEWFGHGVTTFSPILYILLTSFIVWPIYTYVFEYLRLYRGLPRPFPTEEERRKMAKQEKILFIMTIIFVVGYTGSIINYWVHPETPSPYTPLNILMVTAIIVTWINMRIIRYFQGQTRSQRFTS